MDVLCVATAGYVVGGASEAATRVYRVFLEGALSIPQRVRQPWPQLSFARAVQSLLPICAREEHVPFVEDIINCPPFTTYAEWLEAHGNDSGLEQPPTWAGPRSRDLLRSSEGRQDGPFTSKLAGHQCVGFALERSAHFKEARATADSFGVPPGQGSSSSTLI